MRRRISTDPVPLSSAALWAVLGLSLWALVDLQGMASPGTVSSDCKWPVEAATSDGEAGVSTGTSGWTTRVTCSRRMPTGNGVRGPARLLFGARLDLNCADAAALEVLPGIGPARAQAIAAYRRRSPFGRIEDLVRVTGIGPHTLSGLRSWVEVGPSVEDGPGPVGCGDSCVGDCPAITAVSQRIGQGNLSPVDATARDSEGTDR